MKPWLTSRTGVMTLTLLLVLIACLALLGALATQGMSTRTLAASLLILSFVVFGVSGALFTGRTMMQWPIGAHSTHLRWERGLVIAAVLATVLGLALLEDLLHAAGDVFLAQLGLITYLFGAGIVVVAETSFLNKQDWNYPQVVVYVILAFLAQAMFGVALLQTGLVAAWAGWATVIWNLAWPLVMLVVRPKDIYYPVLHHCAPLLIGIALFVH